MVPFCNYTIFTIPHFRAEGMGNLIEMRWLPCRIKSTAGSGSAWALIPAPKTGGRAMNSAYGRPTPGKSV